MTHTELIHVYYAAWIRDDIEAVLALCTDDLVAVNVPIGPVRGKAAVREFLQKFGRGMQHKRYTVEQILESGDSAMVEGVEHYVKDGKSVSLPYMTRFRFRDGKIAEWRDYFDLQTVLRQLGLPLRESRA
jgi:limonene-1,2-epoxide hydrolase